jgi:hypothetical protein
MKTSLKCISCFFKQIETASFLAGLDEKKKEYIFLLLTKKLLKFDFNNPPVVFGRAIYKTVSRISKVKDIFAKEKIKIENFLKRKISFLEKKLEKERNSLYLGAKLSCLGNSVDFGAGEYPDLKKIFLEMERVKFSDKVRSFGKVNHFKLFKKKLKEAKKILFVADNCGEVFFDRLFIKEILKLKKF